jgi:hypothetical protein
MSPCLNMCRMKEDGKETLRLLTSFVQLHPCSRIEWRGAAHLDYRIFPHSLLQPRSLVTLLPGVAVAAQVAAARCQVLLLRSFGALCTRSSRADCYN